MQVEARVWSKENQSVPFSINLPIVVGTIPFWENATNHTPTTLPIDASDDILPVEDMLMEPTASMFPDDDTVSVRTYSSTPPPFPNDGKCFKY